ncbi:MAG: hypothetical protein MUC36_03940 [Planctomycetes bacterium]|jgi:hypothetical protein|nr:hypothetical protein [Planctomycetota bacterium]
MATVAPSNFTELLLMRQGRWFLPEEPSASGTGAATADEAQLRGFELEAAQLGHVLSARLRARLVRCTPNALAARLAELREVVRKRTGGDQALQPLFRRFPDGVPVDTKALWWQRVLVHYLQGPEQPCVWCRATGSTHVLDPCQHIVCDRCFDLADYHGCPICGHVLSRPWPFCVAPVAMPGDPVVKPVRFQLLDLGNCDATSTLATAAEELFRQLLARPQAMSPVDVDALRLVLGEFAGAVLAWLPAKIPARENVAHVFAVLIERALSGASGPPLDAVLQAARAHLLVATDVLRLVTALSGQSPGLVPVPKQVLGKPISRPGRATFEPLDPRRYPPPRGDAERAWLTLSHHRFVVRRLPRRLRRALLEVLDAMPTAALAEDLWRHRSRWLWLGEFLHPGEFTVRLPTIAGMFAWLRNPERVPAPVARWSSRVAAALRSRDDTQANALLAQRPGEWLRRLDAQLRRSRSPQLVLDAFLPTLPRTALPALLALRAHLAQRLAPLPARVFFPKRTFWVPKDPRDRRPPLPAGAVTAACAAIDAELLRRLQRLPPRAVALLDEALATLTVPFAERSASRAGLALARGSSVAIPSGPVVRFFLHWCQPRGAPYSTDIDLSVGFFDAEWRHTGTCSYYELTAKGRDGRAVAKSSGDFTSAPWPDGAAEFVDLDRPAAVAAGYRYALMVVNAYSGQPFGQLARASAGVMLREPGPGTAFAPATVEHAFALDGEHGIFLPMLVDLATDRLHWLDAYATGMPSMNNLASASGTLQHLAAAMMDYFGSSTRASMFELVTLHAAARCPRVIVRGPDGALVEFVRREGETALAFLQRVRGLTEVDGRPLQLELGATPAFVAVAVGDVAVPDGSDVYALFRRRLVPNRGAADLLAIPSA